MLQMKENGRSWLALIFWLCLVAACTPFADYKLLRRTVPWPTTQLVPWSATQTASSGCPNLSGAYRRGAGLKSKFPGYWRAFEEDGINLNPMVVILKSSKEPISVPDLPPNSTLGQGLARAKERTRQQQAFYAKTIAHLSYEAHSLIIRVTDNEQYDQISSIDLRQASIGCGNGALVIRQFTGGMDTYEGKAPRSIRVQETQFRVLPNRNLEVATFDLDWYGENAKTTGWRRSSLIVYERVK
ncbi:MAG TPA: hypothetical protein PKC23_12535 [Candidatus Desulfobacillus sp.]|nr:hypothetical protein [Candidatus Desulfobacillus sp.]